MRGNSNSASNVAGQQQNVAQNAGNNVDRTQFIWNSKKPDDQEFVNAFGKVFIGIPEYIKNDYLNLDDIDEQRYFKQP